MLYTHYNKSSKETKRIGKHQFLAPLEGPASGSWSLASLLDFLAFFKLLLGFLDGPASGSFVSLSFLEEDLPTAPFWGFALRWASESFEASMLQNVAPGHALQMEKEQVD